VAEKVWVAPKEDEYGVYVLIKPRPLLYHYGYSKVETNLPKKKRRGNAFNC